MLKEVHYWTIQLKLKTAGNGGQVLSKPIASIESQSTYEATEHLAKKIATLLALTDNPGGIIQILTLTSTTKEKSFAIICQQPEKTAIESAETLLQLVGVQYYYLHCEISTETHPNTDTKRKPHW